MSFRRRNDQRRGPGYMPGYANAPADGREGGYMGSHPDPYKPSRRYDDTFRPDESALPGTREDEQNFEGPVCESMSEPGHDHPATSQSGSADKSDSAVETPHEAEAHASESRMTVPAADLARSSRRRSQQKDPFLATNASAIHDTLTGTLNFWQQPERFSQLHADDSHTALPDDYEEVAGLTAVVTNVVQVDTRNAQPVPNPAVTGQLVQAARRPPETGPQKPSAVHYYAKTTYRANYFYWFLYALSILASLFYFVVRVVYISTGRPGPQVPINLTIESEGPTGPRNITVGDLLDEVSRQDSDVEVVRIGDEIPEDVLDDPRFAQLRQAIDDETYSYWWSCIVLLAEIGGFILVHMSQQMFVRQDTKFYPLPPEHVAKLRDIVNNKGKLQKVNVMVCTYNEPVETVEMCVKHLLESPEPVYCSKHIYIGDDGAKKKFECSEQKRQMVERFHAKGYTNITWVGDRKALPHQLNGKSSNINHMVLNRMYPHVQSTKDVPYKDILMVMDCDHLVEPEFFAKCCAVMLDRDVAVCLVPQSFHNEVRPDCFDNSNYNFMFRLMPYYFGAGCCFVTGTNVMIRARAAFLACRFDENPHAGDTQDLPAATQKIYQDAIGGSADTHRQLFSETLVAEDIDLGSRVHTLGYKSVFLAEVLAKGEVPRGPRDIWKQRSRWASAAHMYILTPDSVFWYKQRHMSFWQKSLYWIPMVLHWTLIWAEPIMFTMPILCLAGDICPYGVDALLWTTHFFKLLTTFLVSSFADWSLELSAAAIYGQTMARVLFFVNVKAVLNTIMVYTGWKRPGAFKVTNKGGTSKPAGDAPPDAAAAPPPPPPKQQDTNNGGPSIPRWLKPLKLYRIHDGLSKVTEMRKKCMPWDGTFDFWVLLTITLMNLAAVGIGFVRLSDRNAVLSFAGCESQNIQMIALVFAFIEATPGLLFIMYIAVQGWAPWFMKLWVPLVIGAISIATILIEARVGIQYYGEITGAEWAQASRRECLDESILANA